jgi:hypothetical protein
MSIVKKPDEVQRAHDLLMWILIRQMEQRDPPMEDVVVEKLSSALSSLCWYLGHNHNPHFRDILKAIEDGFHDLGMIYDPTTRTIYPRAVVQ